jgi:hypothetical protein
MHVRSAFQWKRRSWHASLFSRGSISKIFTPNLYQYMGLIFSLYSRCTNDISVSLTGEPRFSIIHSQDDACTVISPTPSASCFWNAILRHARSLMSTLWLQMLRVCAFCMTFCSLKSLIYIGFRTLWTAIEKLKEWHFRTDCLKSWRKMKRKTFIIS